MMNIERKVVRHLTGFLYVETRNFDEFNVQITQVVLDRNGMVDGSYKTVHNITNDKFSFGGSIHTKELEIKEIKEIEGFFRGERFE